MEIALIQPADLDDPNTLKKPPSGIMSIAGQVTATMFHGKAEEARPYVEGKDIVGVSTMTDSFTDGIKVARMAKEVNEQVLTVLGGYHASGCAKSHKDEDETETLSEILDHFDIAVWGEGEIVMQKLAVGEPLEEIPGVCYRDADGEIVINWPETIRDLDSLKKPSRDGLPFDKYKQRSGKKDLSLESKRACSNRCKFCATESVHGKRVRFKSPQRAFEEFQELVEEYKPAAITFTDEDFFAKTEWVRQFVDLLKTYDHNVQIDTFAKTNDLCKIADMEDGEEFMAEMKEVGFSSFTIGIESFNAEMLRKHNKDQMILATMTREERTAYKKLPRDQQNKLLVAQHFQTTQKAINFAHKHGIQIMGDYMIGNLGETVEEVLEGFELFMKLRNMHFIYCPIFKPFPGTGLWKEAYDSDKIRRTEAGGIDWDSYKDRKTALMLDYDVEKLAYKLEVSFYTNEEYVQAVEAEIAANPEQKAEFVGLFKYLAEHRYPESEEVKRVLERLS